jgi:N-acetylated-alpha-linked acidic dipeptidase
MVNLIAARLAGAEIPPLDATRYATDFRRHIQPIREAIQKRGVDADWSRLDQRLASLDSAAAEVAALIHGATTPEAFARLDAIPDQLRSLERQLLHHEGLPGRPWYRNLWASPDPDSGYSAWMLPELRGVRDTGDAEAVRQAIDLYERAIGALWTTLQRAAVIDSR